MRVVRRLRWDPGNVAHIARHQVTPDEVEEACHGDYVIGETHHGRLILIGRTAGGRMLAAMLDPEPEPGVYYVVSARSASRRERRQYQHAKGGEGT